MKRLSLKVNLKSIVAALTIAIAGIGLVLASIEKEVEETVTPNVQELHWYFHLENGEYIYLGESATPPTSEECTPPTTDEEICMKGLNTNPPASSVNNSTPAVQEISREPLNN
ncbi:hypothetical protein [Sphingobacterium chuzhouense]|uniref:Uncharacterized protein n=1 Tax=Sphingobacterium chuzhouense TaxID=1742264 RepID=A0ABR7XPX8_9SPHI|nr:hypothetical protein [Sphingobacterium chuzhouense]MBD1421227.1 hypothetical protein [Sphingobacterium chuzhouense]